MIQLDILINPLGLLWGFLFYFVSIFFFFFSRFYLIERAFIVLMCFGLLLIMYNYYYLYLSVLPEKLNIFYEFTNFNTTNGLIDFNLSFHLVELTYLFSLLVIVIGFCTNVYALNYFKNEADEMGFLFWLNSFILSMLILVLAGNFLTLFLGWELIGFTSFFLINFWQSRRATLKSSFKAFSFNLVSDLLLLTALVILYNQYHTTSIVTLVNLIQEPGLAENSWKHLAAICLIGCASIKSVQILGHLWLPDSMEAPVPASSLIHSATLVSAGVFLLLRFNTLILDYSQFIITLGAITAAYGGVCSAAQTDVKKLLAYSTMSHCGFLFILVGFGDCYITIVYLFLHGLFKASTFFCVGSFIRVYGSQDTRLMGGGAHFLWGDSFLLLVCGINLCGLPFTVGIAYKLLFFKILLTSNLGFIQLGLIYTALLSSLVYFYRLIAYTLFDSWKILWGTSSLLFQAFNHRGLRDRRVWLLRRYLWRDSKIATTGSCFAVFLLLTFTFYVYFNIIYFNTVLLRDDNFIPSYGLNSNLLGVYFTQFYNIYLIYFYMFYALIFILLTFVTWKKNFFYYNKLFFYVYALVSLLALATFY